MARDEIQPRDFPSGRRGYDPATVHEHLRRVADEFDRVRDRAPILAGGTSGEQASDHVVRVRTAADGLLGKLDALEGELSGLLDGLRRSGERLTRGLEELGGAPVPGATGDGIGGGESLPSSDEAGARLVALDMALGGTPREETARYLAEHYVLADPEALLDDVYSRSER